MFCDQCEQSFRQTGCVTSPGVCGKDEDVQSLQETLLYGVKGMCAYAHHARRLGKTDPAVDEFVERALFATMTNVNFDLGSMLDLVLECGEKNLRVMEMLDDGHTETYGAPRPTTVNEGTRAGPGILVTGHDMKFLENLLAVVEGTDVMVYTHGEMLPAHMYPKLGDHPNLAGHFGDAWQKQRREFADFPGPIVANTNCVLIPDERYADRIFSIPPVAVPGGRVLDESDLSPLVEKAKSCPPCEEDVVGESTIGFHHSVVASQLPALLDAAKSGALKHVFLIGGCDGAEPGRNYFSDYAQAIPEDCFILTLGCGKYRIRNHDYGTHLGLPRLLDMGQCNDAYGAIKVAVALAGALECGVNDLPLTLVVSWFEQKAVAVLLTLLHLGVTGIRIGPKPPAFVTPNVFAVLQERWNLQLTGENAEADCAAALAV
ncbi:MAG: hydroxylamine reductase [Planctomycetota bacterium]|jgi:hydroxylamine reductase